MEKSYKKWRDVKNFTVLVLAIFLIVAANQPATQLQSSLHIEEHMGTTSISIGQGASIVSFLLLPTIFNDFIGLKYTMFVGFFIESLSILTNYYPSWYTLTPGAILSYSFTGLARAGQGAYTTVLAERFAANSNVPKDEIISSMFGIYNTLSSLGYILGNFVSYFILNEAVSHNESMVARNMCGSFFEDEDHQGIGNFKVPSKRYIYLLFGVLTIIGLFSAFVLLFLEQLPRPKREKKYYLMLLDTLNFNGDWRALVLWTCNLHRGLIGAFVSADLTKAFVTCLMGMETVGLFMIAFGASQSVFCLVFGFLAKKCGLIPLYICAACLEMALLLFNLLWTPAVTHDEYTVYLLAVLWGVVVSGFNVTFCVIHGVLFPTKKESSFANYLLAEYIGSMIGNAYSAKLTLIPKSVIAMCVLLMSTFSFASIQVSKFKNEKKETKCTKVDKSEGSTGVQCIRHSEINAF